MVNIKLFSIYNNNHKQRIIKQSKKLLSVIMILLWVVAYLRIKTKRSVKNCFEDNNLKFNDKKDAIS